MTNFTLAFRMDNAAFDERPHMEAARILQDVADELLEAGGLRAGHTGYVSDVNGNTVGVWRVGALSEDVANAVTALVNRHGIQRAREVIDGIAAALLPGDR